MKYCSHCGAPVNVRIPAGDNRPRHCCDACGTVHYRNPLIVTGCIAEWEGRILLCRRAIRPRYGLWTLPAGFMENGETVQEGAARETREEAEAQVRIEALFTIFTLPHINQVYMLFRGKLAEPKFGPTPETLEARLFDESAIPWQELAFPVVHESLRLFFRDSRNGAYAVHTGEIVREGEDMRRYRVSLMAPADYC